MVKRKLALCLTAILCVGCLAFTCGIFYGRRTVGDSYVIRTERNETGLFALAPVGECEDGTAAPVIGENVQNEMTVVQERLNLNTATSEELQTLPGIGEVLADRIVAYREKNGAFTSIAELLNVEGIGETKYLAIRELIRTS